MNGPATPGASARCADPVAPRSGALAEIVAAIPADFAGDRMDVAVRTLNHAVLAGRDPLGVALADRSARTAAAGERAAAAEARLMDVSARVDAALTGVLRLHAPRGKDDPRCKTCRTSSGKPAPFPCTTYLEICGHGLAPAFDPELIALWHAEAKYRNSRREADLAAFELLVDAFLARRDGQSAEPSPAESGASR